MQIETPKLQEEIIIKSTAIHFGLEVQDFTESNLTDHSSSYQRFVCVYLLRELTILSYDKIALLLTRKATTVRHGYTMISGLEAVKDRRTIADLKEIKLIIDSFTNQKKQQYA